MCVKDFYECDCSCHMSYSDGSWPLAREFGGIIMAHMMPCCSVCPFCSRRIRMGMIGAHEEECSKDNNG